MTTPLVVHERVRANGLDVHVAAAGPADAPLVLCLHGFPESWYSWRHLLPALGDRFRVVAPDTRGYGDTSKPEDGYDLDTLARDAEALIRALGRERAFVVGHDWGGAIAYHLAMHHPQVVERLAVLNCPHPDAFARRFLTSPKQMLRSWYFFFFQVPLLPEWLLGRQGARAVAGSFKRYAARKDRITKEDRDAFRNEMLKPGAIRSALAYYRQSFRAWALLDTLRRGAAPKIRAPSLIVWGEADPILGVELTHGIEGYFEGGLTIQYLKDVGHWTQQEAPEEVAKALRGFFA